MKLNIKLLSIVIACIVFTTACGSKHIENRSKNTHKETNEAEHTERTVALTAMQRKTIGLKLGGIQQRNMSGSIQVTGKLALAPQYKADISAIVGGSVHTINVTEGEKVQKGEIIAMLEHPDFIQMQVDLQQSSSRLIYLKKEYKRRKNLYEKGVSSGKALQEAKSKYFSTKAKVEGLKAKLAMLNLDVEKILAGNVYQSIPVVAPINGYIKDVNVSMGKYVSPGDLLFEIVDNSHIHADLMVFAKDIDEVQQGQEIDITVPSASDRTYAATIYAVGKTFEQKPKAVHVHAEINGSTEGLIPGMYIEGRIAVGHNSVSALPEAAVVGEGERSFIFVKIGEQEPHEKSGEKDRSKNVAKSWVFKQIPVSTGMENNGWVEVRLFKPLPDSGKIAYNAAYKLISEMNKAKTSHSH